MNADGTPLFFSSRIDHEAHPCSWKQVGCYPYYAEPLLNPVNPRLELPSVPADGSTTCTNDVMECIQSNEPSIYSESTLPDSYPRDGTPRKSISESHFQEKAKSQIDVQKQEATSSDSFKSKTRRDSFNEMTEEIDLQRQEATSSDSCGSKKRNDRFNGMTEEDVLKRIVPDLLCPNLDIVIIGSCPGLTAAYLGHHYAGPGNHFWKCLFLSGLIPEPMNASDDHKLKHYGIGFTNFVARCTKGSVEFSRYAITREIKEGVESLTEKIQTYKPKIAAFNGKGIYEVFCNHKNFYVGKQPEPFPGTNNTVIYVMPSSSARCSQLPRASDKVPFFVALRKLRDHLIGRLPLLDETEVVFPDLDLKVGPRKDRCTLDESPPSDRPSETSSRLPDKERKRKHLDCNLDAMDVPHERIYRHALPSPFPSVPHGKTQQFKWSSGFHRWPPTYPGISHPNAFMGMNPDSTYDSTLASQEETQVLNACGLLHGLPPGSFYGGWPNAQNPWMVNGLSTRFNSDTCYPVNIPAYLQYPGHLPESCYRSMYTNFSAYSQEVFLPDSVTSTPSSVLSYSSSHNHDIKAAGGQFDPVLYQRPACSPPSYHHQY